MDIQLAISLLGAVGFGSLLTVLLRYRVEYRQKFREQKISIYSEYLRALSNVVKMESEEKKQDVVYWFNMMQLVAPDSIIKKAE